MHAQEVQFRRLATASIQTGILFPTSGLLVFIHVRHPSVIPLKHLPHQIVHVIRELNGNNGALYQATNQFLVRHHGVGRNEMASNKIDVIKANFQASLRLLLEFTKAIENGRMHHPA